jgi:hypothetical protein
MTYDVDIVERQEQPSDVVRGNADPAHLTEFFRGPSRTWRPWSSRRLAFAGAPFGRFSPTGDGRFDVEAGFPVAGPARPGGTVDVTSLPGGLRRAYGARRSLRRNRRRIRGHSELHPGAGAPPERLPWEAHLDGPDVANPRTEVYFPIRQP